MMRGYPATFVACAFPALLFAAELKVGDGMPYATIRSALAAASSGDRITVHAGVYREGNLLVDKPLTLTGVGRPVLDGGRTVEVCTITASDVSLQGFDIKDGGSSSLDDLAGVKISGARRVVVRDNRIEHCHFGVYVSKSTECTVSGNTITGLPRGEQDTGNGIHLWSCDRVTVTDNTVRQHRDGIYLEFATASRIEQNLVVRNLRYGLHYMFSHDSVYSRNTFSRNGAGVAVMYSRNVEMSENRFSKNWGSSSYGLLLKDMTDGKITGNDFDSNSIGIALHGSNRMTVEGNRFAENGWAIQVQSSSSDNVYRRNNFTGNAFDVGAEGELDNNRFEHNHWQKYEGYDLARDGIGDTPHRPVSLYGVVVQRVPQAVLLLRSPVVHLLDQAEKTFPTITPEGIQDESPSMRTFPFSLKDKTPNPEHEP